MVGCVLLWGLGAASIVAVAKAHLLTGCESVNFARRSDGSCFVENVEVLPFINLPEGGVVPLAAGTSSGVIRQLTEECQSRCLSTTDCAYATLRVRRAAPFKTHCLLKPAPGIDSTPLFVARITDATGDRSAFTYISMPRSCGQQCTEPGRELVSGCGPSSPASCNLISGRSGDDDGLLPAFFDSMCKGAELKGLCGFRGYKCCTTCAEQLSPDHCCGSDQLAILRGVELSGGEVLKTEWRGVLSPEGCHGLCVMESDCTHWNYLASRVTDFVGGGCVLWRFNPVTDITFRTPLSFVTSVVGSVDCHRDYGLEPVQPPWATPTPKPPLGTLIPGTCFERGVDILENSLFNVWRGYFHEPENCAILCRHWPGCHFFVVDVDESLCSLKYSDISRTVASAETAHYIMGPRWCTSQDSDDKLHSDCLIVDVDIEGGDLMELRLPDAQQCNEQCGWRDECQAWTYFEGKCYFKSTAEPQVHKPGAITGRRGCELPNFEFPEFITPEVAVRRQAQAVEAPSSEPLELPGDCVFVEQTIEGVELGMEFAATTASVSSCHRLCLRRPDCRAISFSPAEGGLCRGYLYGVAVPREGSFAALRSCPSIGASCDGESVGECIPGVEGAPQESPTAVAGLAIHVLGPVSPAVSDDADGGSLWVGSGETYDRGKTSSEAPVPAGAAARDPTQWRRVIMVVVAEAPPAAEPTTERSADSSAPQWCIVTDVEGPAADTEDRDDTAAKINAVVAGSALPKCWEPLAAQLYPMKLSVELVAFPPGVTRAAAAEAFETAALVLLNRELSLEKSDSPGSDHGLFVASAADVALRATPMAAQAPNQLREAVYAVRLRAISTPQSSPFAVVLCVSSTELPQLDACTIPLPVPPYDV